MKIIRTFHPIGQGAFYTEEFIDSDKRKFVMVLDCGTETAVEAMDVSLDYQIDSFKNSLGDNPQIDLLFISHFHDDHIKGINKLIDGVKVIRTIIPMLDWPTLTLTRVRNYLKIYPNNTVLANEIDQTISDLYLKVNDSGRFGMVQVVSPDTNDIHGVEERTQDLIYGNKKILSGFKIPYENIWEYIPFNSIEFNDSRARDLLGRLMHLADLRI